MREPPTISLVQQINTLPPVPTYEQSEFDAHGHGNGLNGKNVNGNEHDGSWLEGTFKVTRAVKLVYNPHPTGGINALEERTGGIVPGLGGYELMFRAPVVSLLLVYTTIHDHAGITLLTTAAKASHPLSTSLPLQPATARLASTRLANARSGQSDHSSPVHSTSLPYHPLRPYSISA